MFSEFKGKKLLVVGGTSGIGLAIARQVMLGGGSAVVTGHRNDKAQAALAELSTLGPAWALAADLTDPVATRQMQETLANDHSDISLLVNAAGVFFPKPFLRHNEADYDQYFAFNKAFFFITQAVVAQMVARKLSGAIVNIGSMWGQQAVAATPSSAYSMAKAGQSNPRLRAHSGCGEA